MTKAEELLNSLDETDESLYPEVVEEEPEEPVRLAALYAATATESDEPHVVIFDDRSMYVPDSIKKIGVQFDHDVNLIRFDCPRYSDGVDLYPMQFYVNYIRPDGTPGAYHVEDVTIDETDSTVLHFSWHVLRDATEYQGNLTILVCVKETDDAGNLEHHWNTELNTDFYLSEGLECADTILAEYPDIITQLLTEMDVVKAIATPEAMQGYANTWLNQYGAETVRSVEQKGHEVLASIPEDYTQLFNDVNVLKGDLVNITTATAEDVGKYLKAKTVTGGKVTEWEFGEAGGGSGWVKVADITYNSNKEVVVESIDYELGIFTSTNHGLQDGESVFFVPNGIYKYSPEKYMPVGTLTGTEYKVTNATDNTFSLVGVTMTANQEIDFTKWHLETNENYGSSIFIKNLKLLNDVKVISYGKTIFIRKNQTVAAENNNVLFTVGAYEGKIPNTEFYDGFGNIGYEIFIGNIFGCCETVVTRIDKTHIRSEITALSSNSKNSSGYGVNSNITHAVSIAECLESAKHPKEIKYWNFGPVNGYRIEVYTK